jgi:pimeloyl-ACP methyl ester carboxylesterase
MPATSDTSGPEPSHRLIFLHGFTQTHHHWHHAARLIAQRLGTDPTLAFVDLPGHGLSTDDRHEIAASGPPLADLAGRGTYVGYSMGGRFALTAALANRDVVERLVLVGATPGLLDLDHCSERLRSDRDLAEDLEQIGVDAFLDDWLSAPLFASLPPERRGLEHRRRNTAAGLAHSLRWCGTGIMGTAVWHHLARIPIPVLVLAGDGPRRPRRATRRRQCDDRRLARFRRHLTVRPMPPLQRRRQPTARPMLSRRP